MPSAQLSEARELYFDDPRLGMTVVGRLAVRIVRTVTPLFLVVLAGTFLLSDVLWMRACGLLLLLFLVDLVMHRSQADRTFSRLPRQGSVNVASYVTPAAFRSIERAYDRARIGRSRAYLVLMQELLGQLLVQTALRRLDHDPKEILDRVSALQKETVLPDTLPRDILTKAFSTAVVAAVRDAAANGHAAVEPGDLFAVLPTLGDEQVNRVWSAFSLDPHDVRQALVLSESIGHLQGRRLSGRRTIKHRIMNRAWTSRPTPVLDRIAGDLTDLAREGMVGFLVGHEEEYNRLVESIARPINPHALLIGTPGSGKETLVAHLAAAIVQNDVPSGLFDKRLVKLDVAALLAEVTHDTAAASLHQIVEEIMVAGNVILYIPDFHNLMKGGQAAYLNAADALLPLIMNEQFPVIGTTYPREFVQFVEPRSDVTGVFDVIRMDGITDAHAESILIAESPSLEAQHRVTISFGAIREAVQLGRRYFQQVKPLPASAQELLKEAIVHVVEEGRTGQGRGGQRVVRAEDVMRVAEKKIHVPLRETGAAEASSLLNLENTIHRSLIGQDEAVHAVSEALRQYRSGLSRQGGPIASFLFVGPTGVGKTELAKTLARVQFGSADAMVRFDMTEYQDASGIQRFLGSNDGSVSGALTEAVLASPYRLILLDEFEKAHTSIIQLFLQVLEDGRLTDGLGRTVDFSNTVVIATSNAHADLMLQSLQKGEDIASIEDYLKQKLSDVFAPELLNRFSKIVVFRNLSPAELYKVAELQITSLVSQLSEQHITLTADPAAIRELVKRGYDPAFGARPLRRAIEEQVRSLLAKAILGKQIAPGAHVKLVYENDAFGLQTV